MSFKTTAQKLKTILDTISADVMPVKYEYMEAMPDSFPAGMIILDSGNVSLEEPIDTATNEVTYRFIIRSVFPIEKGQSAAEKWLDLLDTIGAAFRTSANQTLGGSAHRFTIDSYRQYFTQDFGRPAVVLDIAVSSSTLKSI